MMVSLTANVNLTADGGGKASNGIWNSTPCCRVDAGRSATRTTHFGDVQERTEPWCGYCINAASRGAHREQCVPDGAAYEALQGRQARSMGQLAEQGVPSRHCQDAPEGMAKTIIASVRSQPIHLRLFCVREVIVLIVSRRKPKRFPTVLTFIEEYHRGFKQCCGVERCQARREQAQRNYFCSPSAPLSAWSGSVCKPTTVGTRAKNKWNARQYARTELILFSCCQQPRKSYFSRGEK